MTASTASLKISALISRLRVLQVEALKRGRNDRDKHFNKMI